MPRMPLLSTNILVKRRKALPGLFFLPYSFPQRAFHEDSTPSFDMPSEKRMISAQRLALVPFALSRD
jgi:hypothetical protein